MKKIILIALTIVSFTSCGTREVETPTTNPKSRIKYIESDYVGKKMTLMIFEIDEHEYLVSHSGGIIPLCKHKCE
jgi:hypothetical protein